MCTSSREPSTTAKSTHTTKLNSLFIEGQSSRTVPSWDKERAHFRIDSYKIAFAFYLLLLILPTYAYPQAQWPNRLNAKDNSLDEAVSIVTQSQSAFVAGSSFVDGNWDIVLRKMDQNGITIWDRRYGDTLDEKTSSLLPDGTIAIYVVGYRWTPASRWSAVLVKYDAGGTLLWAKDYSTSLSTHDIAISAALLSNKNVALLTRSFTDDQAAGSTIMVIDPAGNEVWKDTYANAQPTALATDGNDIVFVGHALSGADNVGFLALYSGAGTRQFVKEYSRGTGEAVRFTAVAFDNNSNFVTAGWQGSGAQTSNVLAACFKPNGDLKWEYAGPAVPPGRHRAIALAIDPSGRAVVSGRQYSATGHAEMFTLKLKDDGTPEWNQLLNGPGTTSDSTPPLFAGVSAGTSHESASVLLHWPPAKDDRSMPDEIEYVAFISKTSGVHNYASPSKVFHDVTIGVLDSLEYDTDYFVVVRARDMNNNVDTNRREIRIHTRMAPLSIRTDSLPDGYAGKTYSFALEAADGQPPYVWSIVGGDIPTPNFITSSGVLSGFLSIPGTYALDFQVTDGRNNTAHKTIVLTVHIPPDFVSSNGATISAGEHWYNDFIIHSGHTVNTIGSATICVTGKLLIEKSGSLVSPHCDTLIINMLSTTHTPEIYGDILNTCASPDIDGGDLVLRTIHNLQIGSLDTIPFAPNIRSSGILFVGDPWYSPRSKGDTIQYANAIITEGNAPPVCAIKATPLVTGGMFSRTVTFEVIHKDPDGGSSSISYINYGDTIIYNPSPPLTHQYATPGIFHIAVTVRDDDNDSSTAMMTLNVRPAMSDSLYTLQSTASLWATPQLFTADSLIKPVGVPLTLASGIDTAITQMQWDTGDDTDPTSETIVFTNNDDGHTVIFLHAVSLDGSISTASMTMYSPLEGGHAVQYDPPIPQIPFPPLPLSFSSAPPSALTSNLLEHNTECAECVLCDPSNDPSPFPQPLVRILNSTFQAGACDASWTYGFFVTLFGFSRATVVIGPGATFSPRATLCEPSNSSTRGRNGASLHIGTMSGLLVMCGANFISQDGFSWRPFPRGPINGCPASAKGQDGGSSSRFWLTSPAGKISFCGRATVQMANGGDGRSRDVQGAWQDPQPPSCMPGCNATARGGKGGHGGGGIWYSASQVCYDRDYMIEFTGNGVRGGDGGDATAVALAASNCDNCDTRTARGGTGIAIGGKGGGCSWYFLTTFVPSVEVLLGHITVTARSLGGGGIGGDATATGGKGSDGICNGCTGQKALGGNGGNAYANAGRGGYSLVGNQDRFRIVSGISGDATATGGGGGDATMNADPDPAPNGCPGKNGCWTEAWAGDGGFARAYCWGPSVNGAKDTGGDGGTATSHAGAGGNGNGCNCDGGPGGKAYAYGGNEGGGGGAVGGDANATGGSGGQGGDCCVPVSGDSGGDGGAGGQAEAHAGAQGTYSSKGGSGGNGGPAVSKPGRFGRRGEATGDVDGTATDGKDGTPGGLCPKDTSKFRVPLPEIIFDLITPGQKYFSDLFSVDSQRVVGTVNVYFLTQSEFGAPVSYLVKGDTIVLMQGGMKFSDPSFTNPNLALEMRNFKMIVRLLSFNQYGNFYLRGVKGMTTISEQQETVNIGDSGPYTLNIDAQPPNFFDLTVLGTNTPLVLIPGSIEGVFQPK